MRNVIKSILFFLVCFLLVLSVSASAVPAAAHAPVASAVAGSQHARTITLDPERLVTGRDAVVATESLDTGALSSAGGRETDFLDRSGSSGRAASSYFTLFRSSGDVSLCESGSGCASPSPGSGPMHEASAALTAQPSAIAFSSSADLSTWLLLAIGLMMIAAVLVVRRAPELANAPKPVEQVRDRVCVLLKPNLF